ncbi:unnamed protein product [Brassica oleracea var. botrytis]
MVCYMSTPSMMIISTIPLLNTKGLIVLLVLHVTFSEPLYYFLHRSVHRNNYLFTNYHSFHHSDTDKHRRAMTWKRTNNATLLESLLLCVVAGVPLIGSFLLGVGSISLIYGYAITFDFLRCLGHCNVEIFSHKLFETLSILRYLIYTPTYHSLHHQDMETNFCLFMPIFDVLGSTLNPNSWELQKKIRLAAGNIIAFVQNEALNGGGTLFVNKHPDLRVRVVHGNTLTAAVILNEVPKDVKEVFLTGATSKLGRAIALYLCRRGVRVLMLTLSTERFQKIQKEAPAEFQNYLVQVTKYNAAQHCKTWIVGKWLTPREQSWAPEGTHFHQFVVPPILNFRRKCTYGDLAAMRLPKDVQGVGTCEYTVERGVVHACHAGGLVHMLEGWEHHEVGAIDVDRIDIVWEAAMRNGLSSVSSLSE